MIDEPSSLLSPTARTGGRGRGPSNRDGQPRFRQRWQPLKLFSRKQGVALEELLALRSPGCAHREIAEFGRLVGGVPALHDAVEPRGQFAVAIALEPFRLGQPAAQRGGGLLILAGEVAFADCRL